MDGWLVIVIKVVGLLILMTDTVEERDIAITEVVGEYLKTWMDDFLS